MKVKLCSVLVILFLSIGVTNVAQGRGQGHGPAGGPPAAVSNAQIEHGGADHGHANNPSESGKSTNSPRNDISTRLSENPGLASKLQALLPAGMTVDNAAMGFRNFGQFVAAVHVSKNLNIPFDQLKGAMVTNHKSLGDAIHDLKPELTPDSAKAEAKKAEDQAKQDSKIS